MSLSDHAAQIKTIFCDIDGCIFKHHGDLIAILANDCELLPGVLETFRSWNYNGYTVILVTGRPESFRELTELQIRKSGLFYTHLLMNLPRGQRIIINDIKPGIEQNTAACINLIRNEGMENVES